MTNSGVVDSPRSALARAYIVKAIENSHAAIKSCWTIMFTAGTFGALQIMNEALRCNNVISHDTGRGILCTPGYTEQIYNYILCFVIYFLTFARFYLGDIRIFDIKYSEMFSLIAKEIDALKSTDSHDRFRKILLYSDREWYKWEVIALIFQTLLVVFLAFEIDISYNFLIVYITLLTVNSVWLLASNVFSKPVIQRLEEEVFPEWYSRPSDTSEKSHLPRSAAIVWVSNNALHAVAISAILVFLSITNTEYNERGITIGLILCFTNCCVDFYLSQSFYFPKFYDKYIKTLENGL